MARSLLGVCFCILACLATVCLANVPIDLTNFQNEYACDMQTAIVRPRTLDDVAEAVRLHQHIQANGEGHSWNQPFFCASTTTDHAATAPAAADATAPTAAGRKLLQPPAADPLTHTNSSSNSSSKPQSANIAMTTLRPLNITVDESDPSVWVDAGVKVIDLLQFLANYVTPAAPSGYTLGAFPWFVYQTVAGAVATGTHGSNLGPHKSLSNQVLALDMVLANGTRRVFTNESDPFLMKALRVSVGQLGIIGRVKFHIVPEVPVRRTLEALTTPQFLDLLTSAQEGIAKGEAPPAWMNETQFFWLPQTQQFMMVGFSRSDDTDAENTTLAGFVPDSTTVFSKKGDLLQLGELVLPADVQLKVNQSQVLLRPAAEQDRISEPYVSAQRWLDGFVNTTINTPLPAAVANRTDADSALTQGVSWALPSQRPAAAAYVANNSAAQMLSISAAGIGFVAGNVTAEATSVYIKQPALSLANIQNVPYDQYEVSIPMTTMADCWRKVLEVVHEGDLAGTNATQRARDKGLRTAALIRFIGQEDGLLSHTNDGPRMYINLEDYVFYNANRTRNEAFRSIMAILKGDKACTQRGVPRMHWGKAGWPDKGCWHGDQQYGDNWCHFGCAVQQLDPSHKFADSASDRWNWAGVDLGLCCGPEGFKTDVPGCECRVRHDRQLSDCPPAPFYTSR